MPPSVIVLEAFSLIAELIKSDNSGISSNWLFNSSNGASLSIPKIFLIAGTFDKELASCKKSTGTALPKETREAKRSKS